MTLDSAPKTTPTDPSDIPLVGTATGDEDKDSDEDGPIPDMDDYTEDDDPVRLHNITKSSCDLLTPGCCPGNKGLSPNE